MRKMNNLTDSEMTWIGGFIVKADDVHFALSDGLICQSDADVCLGVLEKDFWASLPADDMFRRCGVNPANPINVILGDLEGYIADNPTDKMLKFRFDNGGFPLPDGPPN